MRNTVISFIKCFCLVFAIAIILPYGCASNKNKERSYINNDSLAVYSTHPGRPFRYGFPISGKLCIETFGYDVNAFDLKKGEVVAEVGAASGWKMGAISVLTDSITYYVQDIDTHYLNQYQFGKMTEHFTSVRTTPQTNKFYFVLGDETKTGLPENTFDKIIITNSFHEFSQPEQMIEDLSSKLKPGGKIIINEVYSSEFKTRFHKGCVIRAYKLETINRLFQEQGFYLVKSVEPDNAYSNYLWYEKNEQKAKEFEKRKKTVASHIRVLDSLNLKVVSKDSITTLKIAKYLKENLATVNTVYHSLSNYISELGEEWLNEKQYIPAINVLKVNTILYPDSANYYVEVGDALEEAKLYDQAISFYTQALKLDSLNGETYGLRASARYLTDYYDEAIEDYQKAIKLDPENEHLYRFNLSYIFEDMEDPGVAFNQCINAIYLKPKDAEYHYRKAEIRINMGEYEEALKDIENSIKYDSLYVDAYNARAIIKKHMGDDNGAKEDLKKAKSIKKLNKKKKRKRN